MNRKQQIKLKHFKEKMETGFKLIGRCKCGNALFISTICKKEHIFNAYCTVLLFSRTCNTGSRNQE